MDALREILNVFSRFPYENLSKIIKYRHHFNESERIRLPVEVIEDHVSYGLGGTCFSLTFFLQTVLTLRGYRCYPVMADMRWGRNVHCAVVVVLDGIKYLVDPGYLLNQPMAFGNGGGRVYRGAFAGVEVVPRPGTGTYDLYTFDRMQKKWRYRFYDHGVSPETFLDHWHASFTWNSMHGLCLTKVEKGRMVYVHKTFMRETTFDKKKNIQIKDNYHGTIHRLFAIAPEVVEEALVAVEVNMTRERELGLWVPKKEWRPIS
jgi:arylamine N-acetyltransferase